MLRCSVLRLRVLLQQDPLDRGDAGEVVAVDAVVLDPVAAAAEQQDAGPDRDERRGAASSRTANGGLPSWKLKLFQKMSLSMISLSSAGGNFSESSAFGTMPSALL